MFVDNTIGVEVVHIPEEAVVSQPGSDICEG